MLAFFSYTYELMAIAVVGLCSKLVHRASGGQRPGNWGKDHYSHYWAFDWFIFLPFFLTRLALACSVYVWKMGFVTPHERSLSQSLSSWLWWEKCYQSMRVNLLSYFLRWHDLTYYHLFTNHISFRVWNWKNSILWVTSPIGTEVNCDICQR